jgi:hypothetical protein
MEDIHIMPLSEKIGAVKAIFYLRAEMKIFRILNIYFRHGLKFAAGDVYKNLLSG